MSENLNLNDLEQVSGGNDGLGSNRPANVKTGTNYVIKSGDTLTAIARKYGSTVKKIFDANDTVLIAEANKHGVYCNNRNDYANHIWPGTAIVIPA